MKNVTVKIPVERIKYYPGNGRKSFAKLRSRIVTTDNNNFDVVADTPAELQEKTESEIRSHLCNPRVKLVVVGDEIRVILSHAGHTETLRPVIKGVQGVVALTSTCYSGNGIQSEADLASLHLAKCSLNPGDPAPAWLTPQMASEFESWGRSAKSLDPAFS